MTRRLAEQTARAAHVRMDVDGLMERVGRVSREQRAGHLFEVMSADEFNRRAIDAGGGAWAFVNACEGLLHTPADIRVVGADGAVREAQAKLYGGPLDTAYAQASPKYRGMDRLVAEDQHARITEIYDGRLKGHPDGLRWPDHADARAHLVDRLQMDGIESDPVTRAEALRAADGPKRWADQRWATEAGRQVGVATLTGAAIGAVSSGVIEAVTHIASVRSGETSLFDATRYVVGAALEGGARNGAVSGLGATLEVIAGRDGFGATLIGKVPVGAAASALVGITESALAFARGRIDKTEFALRACESTFVSGMSWAGGAVGQAVVPVPLVGALAGGLAAQWCATLIAQGVRRVLATAEGKEFDAERVAVLKLEAGTAAETAELLAAETRTLGAGMPALLPTAVVSALESALLLEDPDDGLDRVDDVFRTFAGTPIFDDVDEFDTWFADTDAVLVLDPNVAAPGT
ncbi:hypothetical protein GCM10023201_33200 [Actinomycetospora corticicola]|uniref:Uncharacterized protein n=1 Tax=Actinomycetospora corticicola TaxID=663602 RepID=A0A7Y9DS73_9PSEU|nr:hypothetical protein [Actinomycetospora corticicola]NYD34557.1 hypothetical protein [Actinomycetospora corticicola]